MVLEVNKHHVKVQYDKFVHPRRFNEGDRVLLWDQDKEPLGVGKFNPMWYGHVAAATFSQIFYKFWTLLLDFVFLGLLKFVVPLLQV